MYLHKECCHCRSDTINFLTTKRSTKGKLESVCRFATFEHVAREAVGAERVLAVSDDGPLIYSPRLGDPTVQHRNGVISHPGPDLVVKLVAPLIETSAINFSSYQDILLKKPSASGLRL